MNSNKEEKKVSISKTDQQEAMRKLASELEKETKPTKKAAGTIHQIGYAAEGDYPDF